MIWNNKIDKFIQIEFHVQLRVQVASSRKNGDIKLKQLLAVTIKQLPIKLNSTKLIGPYSILRPERIAIWKICWRGRTEFTAGHSKGLVSQKYIRQVRRRGHTTHEKPRFCILNLYHEMEGLKSRQKIQHVSFGWTLEKSIVPRKKIVRRAISKTEIKVFIYLAKDMTYM